MNLMKVVKSVVGDGVLGDLRQHPNKFVFMREKEELTYGH